MKEARFAEWLITNTWISYTYIHEVSIVFYGFLSVKE